MADGAPRHDDYFNERLESLWPCDIYVQSFRGVILKMRFVQGVLLAIFMSINAAGADDPSPAQLRLAIDKAPDPMHIQVSIGNASAKPLKIWQEWNEWGGARWRVLVVTPGHVDTYFQDPDQVYSPNMPLFDEIGPGKEITRVLNLADGKWRGPDPKKVRFQSGEILVVIYDVPKTYPAGDQFSIAASKMGVWYGVATASATIGHR